MRYARKKDTNHNEIFDAARAVGAEVCEGEGGWGHRTHTAGRASFDR